MHRGGICLPLTAIPERVPIERDDAAHPALTEPNAHRHPLSRGSLRLGRDQCFAVSAFSAWMSSACSATLGFTAGFPLPTDGASSRR
jgi:hypothetical protein